ncbi:hypothetical protein ACNTMW_32050 [Planosporangium sp. 12N6]|uniref:hypothetical protein n=1 Tax=Planosporangium spinosum TaxID=3402278 RepID=UPI003CE7D8CC
MDNREDRRGDTGTPRGIDDTVPHPEEIVQQTSPAGDPRPWIGRNDEVPGSGRLADDICEAVVAMDATVAAQGRPGR